LWLSVFAQANHLFEHALGNFPLRRFGNINDVVAGDDGDGVAVGVEANSFAGDIVDHDRVERLREKFGAGVLQNVLGFGSKANDYWDCFLRASSTRMSAVGSSSNVMEPCV